MQYKMNKIYILLLISVICVGCKENIFIPKPSPDKYLNYVVVCAGGTSIDRVSVPSPDPEPSPEEATKTKDCQECGQQGFFGDGRPRRDCPYCDYNEDGNNQESLNEVIRIWKDKKRGEVILDIDETEDFLAESTISWLGNSPESLAKASQENKAVLILLSSDSPSDIWDNEEIIGFVDQNFVPLWGKMSLPEYENAWASRAIGTSNVTTQDGISTFTGPVICVLNNKGQFITNSDDTFHSVPNDSLELMDILNQMIVTYNKETK